MMTKNGHSKRGYLLDQEKLDEAIRFREYGWPFRVPNLVVWDGHERGFESAFVHDKVVADCTSPEAAIAAFRLLSGEAEKGLVR
jgi:hypothetical protein